MTVKCVTVTLGIPEIDSYFQSLKIGNKSEMTIRNYRKDLIKLLNYFNVKSMDDIQKLTLVDYKKFVGDLKLSPSSINSTIRNLSAFLHSAQDDGYIKNCKFFDMKFGKGKFVKEPKKSKAILNDDESYKIINAAKNSQVKFMLALMIWGGLRNSEVRSIKLEDVRGNELTIHGKGQKERVIAFNPILEKFYKSYIENRNNNSPYMFFSNHNPDEMLTSKAVADRIDKAYKDAGLSGKNITPHSLRRTAASNMIREHDIRAAQRFLGHSDISTTLRYDQNNADYIKDIMIKTTRTFGFENE